MTLTNRAIGAVVAAAAMAAIAAASHVRMASHATSDGVLRLAWSALPERIETCRSQGEAELAKLPRHMRQSLVCEGAAARYRLTVRISERVIADKTVRAGGLRRDRRLYVLEELPLPAGEADIAVLFERIEQAQSSVSASQGAVPARMALAGRFTVAPHAVTLVTYDPGRRELVFASRSPAAP
jgi:hypothetical protein